MCFINSTSFIVLTLSYFNFAVLVKIVLSFLQNELLLELWRKNNIYLPFFVIICDKICFCGKKNTKLRFQIPYLHP